MFFRPFRLLLLSRFVYIKLYFAEEKKKMAFKPITKEKEIKGKKYVAQFNGVSTLFSFNDETDGKLAKQAQFIFDNVLVSPKISDPDEYFGTDVELMNEVVAFCSAVMRGDAEYFPKSEKQSGDKEATKK